MASSGQAITASFYAFIASTSLGKTGDSASFTMRIVKDGTEATPAGAVVEIDATNCPGLYKIPLTGAENTGGFMALHGKSSTSGVVLQPALWTNENLPTAVPGAADGVLIAGTNAPVTITGSGSALSLISTGANGSGLVCVGEGSGAGIDSTGAGIGAGMVLTGGASGDGMELISAAADPIAFTVPDATRVPSAADTFMQKFSWIATLAVNKITCSSTQEKLFAADGSTVLGTAALSDTGAVGTRGQFG